MDFTREKLFDYYKNPRCFGEIKDADCYSASESLCGDKVNVFLNVKGDVIEDAKFTGEGCAFCIASASMLMEHVLGKGVVYAKGFSSSDLFSLIGFQPVSGRVKCALLGLSVLHKALDF